MNLTMYKWVAAVGNDNLKYEFFRILDFLAVDFCVL